MPCESPKYVGREVAVEFVISCGDVMPAENEWLPIGAVRSKEDSSEWDNVDVTADDDQGNKRSVLATYRTDTLSLDGVSRRSDGTLSNQTLLYKHFKQPTETGSQPIAMFRITYPDITVIDTYLLTSFTRSSPYDDAATWSLEASSTTSAVGQVITDTPVVP